MPPETGPHGGSEAPPNALTPAQKLQEKHKADAAHRATVEDDVDEAHIIHHPPPMHNPSEEKSTMPAGELLSSVAAGKQKAREDSNGVPIGPKSEPRATLDTQSEELFPALGRGPKSQVPTPIANAWGAKKTVAIGQAYLNGTKETNGIDSPSTSAPSRASTPASGIWTPNSTTTPTSSQPRGGLIPRLPMPGNAGKECSERIQFMPAQLVPRNQLKKPILDVLRSINKRSKANVEMKPGPKGSLYFEGSGPVEAVRQALKEIAKEIGSKQSVKIPIPRNVRQHIIGRQGAVVQAIMKRTGAHIHVPNRDKSPLPDFDDDDSATIDIAIEGDAVAAELARREVEAIVNERTSTVNMRLRNIPAEFFPFIAGPHNIGTKALENGRQLKVEIPHHYTWSQPPLPPTPSSGMVPQFAPDPNSHIRISGERLIAQQVRAEIERQAEHLHRQITFSPLVINRGQHQFIAGENGGLLHDLLKETGCAVILPPASDATETLYVTGPHDKIELGIEKVMNLATAMQMSSVDVARQHANAPKGSQVHARTLTRYLQQRQAIEQLERQYDARIVLPTTQEGPMNWEVYSRDGKNTIRARSDIMNLVNAYPPARIRHVKADPFFHRHLDEQGANTIRSDFGVYLLLPEEPELRPEVILIYEGPEYCHAEDYQLPRHRPSASELVEIEKILDEAQAYILGIIQGQEEIGSASVGVPPKFHEKVRKFVNLEQQERSPRDIPVQMTFGPASVANGSMPTALRDQQLTLRGPSSAVEELTEKIVAFIEEVRHNELERGHVTTFDFPQKFANVLIGKRGENINKYREEFDVDIQINDGKVEIKGPKAKADLARSKITALGRKLEDETTYVLKIRPQYHRGMIGAKGNQVNRLQERYSVRVQFPRSSQVSSDERSTADGASEAGGSRHGRTHQAPDEVIIRGPKKGADDARDELLNLLQWTIDNSHTSTVSVAQSQLPSLIGQGGREMESVRLSTGAQIDVPGSRDAVEPSGRAQIQIKGTKKQVEEAKRLLEQRAKVFDDSITKTIDVDKKYHKALIGTGGSNIRSIVLEAGGSDDRRELARTVKFPRQESNENTIRVEGNRALVEKVIDAIQSFANQRDSQAIEVIEVVPEKHRLLIGRGGETKRNLESHFKVIIDVPKISQQGPTRSQVKLAGLPQDVERAKDHILTLVKDEDGETVQVPRRIHHTVSNNGQFFRHLRADHKVTVDHAGQHPPSKPACATRSQANGADALPLITDHQSSEDKHSWAVVEFSAESKEEGDIPWILRGSSENVAKARTVLERAIEQAQAQQQSSTGYLVLPDPRTYRYIVGQGGSQINSIRKQTGCKITVPRDQAKGEAIEIVGSREGVEHAKDIILGVVQNGGNGGNGGRRQ